MSSPAATPNIVLVTGANGFIGTATVLELIRRGYKVKGVVRRQDSIDAFNKKYPEHIGAIEWVTVPVVTDLEAMTAVAQNVDYVIHLASPFVYNYKDSVKDVLIPALDNTRVILQAAATYPRVKHVVIMSSFAAVINPLKGLWPEKTYDDNDWNPTTWDEAAQVDVPPYVYSASKAIAEHAAWDFVKQTHPSFSITAFCPPMVYGPPMQPFHSLDHLNESTAELWALFGGKATEIPPTGYGNAVPVFIDVRDLAFLTVAALTNDKAKNQRYMVVAGHYSFDQVVAIARDAFPKQASRMLPTTGAGPAEHFKTDSSKAERDFGMQWIPFATTIKDTAAVLFEAEEKLGADKH